MESKTPMQELIDKLNSRIDSLSEFKMECEDSFDDDGISRSDGKIIELAQMKYHAVELMGTKESTLIAEHNMMKEALENMEDAPLGFNFRLTAKETLKKLGR